MDYSTTTTPNSMKKILSLHLFPPITSYSRTTNSQRSSSDLSTVMRWQRDGTVTVSRRGLSMEEEVGMELRPFDERGLQGLERCKSLSWTTTTSSFVSRSCSLRSLVKANLFCKRQMTRLRTTLSRSMVTAHGAPSTRSLLDVCALSTSRPTLSVREEGGSRMVPSSQSEVSFAFANSIEVRLTV